MTFKEWWNSQVQIADTDKRMKPALFKAVADIASAAFHARDEEIERLMAQVKALREYAEAEESIDNSEIESLEWLHNEGERNRQQRRAALALCGKGASDE